MPNLQDVLKDKSKFPDDLKLNLNGVEVSMADVRTFYTAEETRLAAEKKELQLAQETTAKFYADLLETEKELKKAPVVPKVDGKQAYDYDSDPIFSPFKKQLLAEIETAKTDAKEAKALADKQAKEAQQLSAHYINREWKREYNALPKEVREKFAFKDVLEFANKERLTDELGIPSLTRAAEKLGEPLRAEAVKKAGFDEGYKKARQEMAMASMPKPGLSGLRSTTEGDGKTKSYGSLDEAIAAAKQDPEIIGSLTGFTQ